MGKPEYSITRPEEKAPETPLEPSLKSPGSVPKNEAKDELVTDGAPMSVEHFGIKGWSELLLTPQLDFNKTVEKVSFIEDFIKGRISDDRLKPDKENFSRMIRDMEYELGLSDTHEPLVRVNRIFNLLKMIDRTAQEKAKKNSIFMLLNSQK